MESGFGDCKGLNLGSAEIPIQDFDELELDPANAHLQTHRRPSPNYAEMLE